MPRVAIIYLAYKVRPYLEQVFLSLERLSYPKECLHVLIADNASPDGEAEWIRANVLPKSERELPRVTFLPGTNNEGYSAGNNLAIERALLEGADYVYLLNGDARLHPEAIAEAVAAAEADPTVGSAQSLIRLWQDEDVLNSTGGMVHFLGFGFVRDNGVRRPQLPNSPTPQLPREIAYASGAAVLYRASVLREVGLLDPFYFLYHEDLELGWRIRLAGYKNILAARSVAYHHYEFRRSIQKFFWMERNRWLVHVRHLKLPTLLLLLPGMLALELALLAFAIKGGWLREKLLVYADLLRPKTWAHTRRVRRQSQVLRKVSDREIVRLWTGRIAHQETANWVVERVGNPFLGALWVLLRTLIRW